MSTVENGGITAGWMYGIAVAGMARSYRFLRLHEPGVSVCTSRTLALCRGRVLALCRSWPCLRNKLCSQKFLQDTTPFPPANPTTHASHPNCRSGIYARLVLPAPVDALELDVDVLMLA